jgi:hypothetical protein
MVWKYLVAMEVLGADRAGTSFRVPQGLKPGSLLGL